MKAEDQLAEREALPPLPGALVIAALRAMDAEARKRGEMFPQTADEQREDTLAVRKVIESLEFYTGPRQCGPNGWPSVKNWPALPVRAALFAREAPAREGVQAKYDELLFAVHRKFPGESRHETALRYIRDSEESVSDPGGDARAKTEGSET